MVRVLLILLFLVLVPIAIADDVVVEIGAGCAGEVGDPLDSIFCIYRLNGVKTGDTTLQYGDTTTKICTTYTVTANGYHTWTVYQKFTGYWGWVNDKIPYNNVEGSEGGSVYLRVYAVDTSGVWTSVSDASITAFPKGGGTTTRKITSASGYTYFWGTENDSIVVYGSKWGYDFDACTLAFPASDGLDTIYGRSTSMPGQVSSINYVAAYIDLGTSTIDSSSGNMTPLTDVKGVCNLIGEDDLILQDSAFLIIPTTYIKTPDATGRITFYIPVNTKLTPPGSYYELSFRGITGQPFMARRKIRFIVDTLPDPINILTATRVP